MADHTHSDYADGFDAGKAQALEQVLNFLQHAQKNPDRGDEVFRCGFNGALDVVAARVREMQSAAGVTPAPEPIPPGIYYILEMDNFYSEAHGHGQGNEFYAKWKPRAAEFPQRKFPQTACGVIAPDGAKR